MQKEVKEKRTKEITKKLLLALAGGAFLTVAMIAPGIVIAAKPFLELKNYDQRRLRSTIKRLKRQKVIEFQENEKGETIIKITKRGEEKILKYRLQDLKIQKPKKWDRIWRIVIFDIPNKKRIARETLREKLKELGFYKLQKSVFVCPYECENEIEFIKAIFNIQPYVLLIRAKNIDNEELIQQYFQLE